MANKPAPVTDAEAEEWQNWAEEDVDGVEGSDGVEGNHDEMFLRLLADRTRYREVLRLWDDHLPGCSGSPRCECGYAEARALLGEVQDAK